MQKEKLEKIEATLKELRVLFNPKLNGQLVYEIDMALHWVREDLEIIYTKERP